MYKEQYFNSLVWLFEKHKLNYNIRSLADFSLDSVNTVASGLKSLKDFPEKVWNIVLFEIRNSESIEEFLLKIKKWET